MITTARSITTPSRNPSPAAIYAPTGRLSRHLPSPPPLRLPMHPCSLATTRQSAATALADRSRPRHAPRPRHTTTPTSSEDASSAPSWSTPPSLPALHREHADDDAAPPGMAQCRAPWPLTLTIYVISLVSSRPPIHPFPAVLVKFLLASNRSAVASAFHVRLSSPSASRGRTDQRPGRSHDIQLLPTRSPWLRLPSTTPTSNAAARSRGADHHSEPGRTSARDLHDAASAEDRGAVPRTSAASLTSADAAAAQR
jgi:hypothetical protein